jgi:hypothetical protein
MGVAKEVICGDRHDLKNVFRWDKVVLNLPGSENCNPSKPWVYKLRLDDWQIAADLFIFVDDLWPTGPSRKEAWLAARHAASKLNYLGVPWAPCCYSLHGTLGTLGQVRNAGRDGCAGSIA